MIFVFPSMEAVRFKRSPESEEGSQKCAKSELDSLAKVYEIHVQFLLLSLCSCSVFLIALREIQETEVTVWTGSQTGADWPQQETPFCGLGLWTVETALGPAPSLCH